jgi:hypothetical protein
MENLRNIDVEELVTMSGDELSRLWLKVFGKAPPTDLRRQLKIPILAARIQEDRYGGLSKESKNRLKRIGDGLASGKVVDELSRPQIKPGTRIVREWKGQAHVVVAFADHYEYQDQRFSSLSEIARKITGTRWSGPLFFGLKKPAGGPLRG